VKNDDSSKKVILDTNSLIYAVRTHVDLRDQITYLVGRCEIIVPQCVLDELKGLSTGNMSARTALGIVQRFIIVKSEGKGDECVFSTAVELDAYVVTNDRKLALKLHENGIKCLMFTAKKTLAYWNINTSR
jgi:rRNA-processing protein FCF1